VPPDLKDKIIKGLVEGNIYKVEFVEEENSRIEEAKVKNVF